MNRYTILSESDQRWRNQLALQLSKETRLPIARVLMSTWSQLEANKYRTATGREIELSEMLAQAIDRLPRTSRFIFTASPFPPTIPDRYLEPAKRWARRHNRLAHLIQ